MRQKGLFGLSDQLKRLSDCGDPLETIGRVVDFEAFRPELASALAYGDGAKGGRPPYDPVAMFKVLIGGGDDRAKHPNVPEEARCWRADTAFATEGAAWSKRMGGSVSQG